MRVLLVEDDLDLGAAIKRGLEQRQITVDWLQRGGDVAPIVKTESIDAVILDLGLPDLDGVDVLKQVRAAKSQTPVIVLTARGDIDDRVNSLDAGADDYMVKPFDLRELEARLRSIVRRSLGRAESFILWRDYQFDPAGPQLRQGDQTIDLPAKALVVFEALLNSAGGPVSKSVLENVLYGWDEGVASNAIEVYIHQIRKHLGSDAVKTIRGVGYMLPR